MQIIWIAPCSQDAFLNQPDDLALANLHAVCVRKARDRRTNHAYRTAGWAVMRVWEHDRDYFHRFALEVARKVRTRARAAQRRT